MIDHDLGQKSDRVLKNTPLTGLYEELGARMVPFAGYLMPVQYPDGIIAARIVTLPFVPHNYRTS